MNLCINKLTISTIFLVIISSSAHIERNIFLPLAGLPLILPSVYSEPIDLKEDFNANNNRKIIFPGSTNQYHTVRPEDSLLNGYNHITTTETFKPTLAVSYEVTQRPQQNNGPNRLRPNSNAQHQYRPDRLIANHQPIQNNGPEYSENGNNNYVANAQYAIGQFPKLPSDAYQEPVQNRPQTTPASRLQTQNTPNYGEVHNQNNLNIPREPVPTISNSQHNQAYDQNASSPAQQLLGAYSIFASVTGFGLDLMKALDEAHTGNVVVSPFSIALTLALLQQGTEGNSQIQINNALHMTPAQAREIFHVLVTQLQNRRSRNILNIATSIFVNEEFTITPEYKNHAVQYFGSDLTPMNFKNSQVASKYINNWVSSATYGNIPYLVSPDAFSDETQLVLANAVYFKGLWNSTFNPQRTVSRPFYLANGSTRMASFMHHYGKFQGGIDKRLDAQWLVMPFEDLQYSLIVLVPSVETGVTSLLRRITIDHLVEYLRAPQRDVVISMPKFKVRIDTELVHPLNALGIYDIFTYKSGLSALVTPRGDRPRVSSALHTAVLSIDEQGGSAAAATLLAVSTLSLDLDDNEIKFKADRPFVTLLWDNQLNIPLFMAKIADPAVVN